MSLTQDKRLAAIDTSLGKDVLLVHRLSFSEQLARLFHLDLELISTNAGIKFDDIVGQNVTVRIALQNNKQRFINGFVNRFTQVSSPDRHAHYRASVVPWFWFLTRTADCRIFQNKNIPKIIEEIFTDRKFSDYRLALNGSYPDWDYCVQYRETDFNFVSRLMEQEGMYYYFEHAKGKHTLVITDSNKTLKPFPDYATIPFLPDPHDARDKEIIHDWFVEKEVQPGVCALNDFDFTKPSTSLLGQANVGRGHAKAEYEIYDYPGEHEEQSEGADYSQVRLDEFQTQHETVQGQANALGLCAGSTFKLADYPRKDQNREYLITGTNYQITSDVTESGAETSSEDSCSCSFTAIPNAQPFRPARTTPKPLIQGPQTAMVTGPGGEEIHTDEYGRVKVKFHWDRHNDPDDKSSCWVRVSQVWAGANWGAMHIPRIGQEVIVEFLEADPDRPIITGRVYNAESMPPYGLPGNKTQSGIKSRSSKGGDGGNFNEIRFEDKKGEEQVYVHAEKNQDNIVENDETTSVGHDRTEDVGNDEKITIGNNRTEKVGVNEDITIGSNRTEKVGANESIDVGASRTRTVGKSETVTVALMRTHTVGVNEAITVGAAQEITVGAAQTITVGAVQAITVGANQSTTVGSNQSNTIASNQTNSVGKDQSDTIAKNRTTSVGENDTLTVGKKIVISAGDEISITTGKASITMKKDGTISIKGKDITIEGSGEINVKASKDITMKGKKILQN